MTSLPALVVLYKKPLAILAIIGNLGVLGIIGYNFCFSPKKNEVECFSSSSFSILPPPPQSEEKTFIGEEPPGMLDELIPTAEDMVGLDSITKSSLDPQLIDTEFRNVTVNVLYQHTVNGPNPPVTQQPPQVVESKGDLEAAERISSLPLKSHLGELPLHPASFVPFQIPSSASKKKQRREAKTTIAVKRKKKNRSKSKEDEAGTKWTVIKKEPPKKHIVTTPEITGELPTEKVVVTPEVTSKRVLTLSALRKGKVAPLLRSKRKLLSPPKRPIVSIIQPKWSKTNSAEFSTTEIDVFDREEEKNVSNSLSEEEKCPIDTKVTPVLPPHPQPLDSANAGSGQAVIRSQSVVLPSPNSAPPSQSAITRLFKGFSLSPRNIFRNGFSLSTPRIFPLFNRPSVGNSKPIAVPPVREASTGRPARNRTANLKKRIRIAESALTDVLTDPSEIVADPPEISTEPIVIETAESRLLHMNFSDAQDLALVISQEQIVSINQRFIQELTLVLKESSRKPILISSDLLYEDVELLKSLLSFATSTNIFKDRLWKVGDTELEIKAFTGAAVNQNVGFVLIFEDYQEPVSSVQVEEIVDDAEINSSSNKQIIPQYSSKRKESNGYNQMFSSSRRMAVLFDSALSNSTKVVIRAMRPFKTHEEILNNSLVLNEIGKFVLENDKNSYGGGEIVPYEANAQQSIVYSSLSQLATRQGRFSFLGKGKNLGMLKFGSSGIAFASPYLKGRLNNRDIQDSFSRIFKSPSLSASGWMVASYKPEKKNYDSAIAKTTTISQAQVACFVVIVVLKYATMLNLQKQQKNNQRFPNIFVDLNDVFTSRTSFKSPEPRRRKPDYPLLNHSSLSPIVSNFVEAFVKNSPSSPARLIRQSRLSPNNSLRTKNFFMPTKSSSLSEISVTPFKNVFN